MPIITNTAPVILENVICSSRNKIEHIIVINGELAIIIVTDETAPLFIAAKYAKSPIRVANIASTARRINAVDEIFLRLYILPFINIMLDITISVNVVLTAKPINGFTSFKPSFTNKGAIPQHVMPIKAKRNTM